MTEPTPAPLSAEEIARLQAFLRRLRYPNVDPAGLKALRLEAADLIDRLLSERSANEARIAELEWAGRNAVKALNDGEARLREAEALLSAMHDNGETGYRFWPTIRPPEWCDRRAAFLSQSLNAKVTT